MTEPSKDLAIRQRRQRHFEKWVSYREQQQKQERDRVLRSIYSKTRLTTMTLLLAFIAAKGAVRLYPEIKTSLSLPLTGISNILDVRSGETAPVALTFYQDPNLPIGADMVMVCPGGSRPECPGYTDVDGGRVKIGSSRFNTYGDQLSYPLRFDTAAGVILPVPGAVGYYADRNGHFFLFRDNSLTQIVDDYSTINRLKELNLKGGR